MTGLPEDVTRTLSGIVGPEHLMTNSHDLASYSSDATFLTHAPDLVVLPGTTGEISQVMSILDEHRIPVTTRGAGSGLSGGAVPIHGGVVLSMERMQKIELHPDSLTATVEPGAITGELARQAAAIGLMYPPDPASLDICTLGGNIATNAGGPSCLKYGVTSEYVQGLEVVLANGSVLKLGGKSRKRSSGYRMIQLFVGSEGTLGIITKAILRVIPKPRHRGTILAGFGSVDDCASSVTSLLQAGNLPAACELIDASSLRFVSDLLPSRFPLNATAVLLIEQDGNDLDVVRTELDEIKSILMRGGAFSVVSDVEDLGREDLWKARRAIGLRLIEKRTHRLPEDVGVPIDRIPDMVRAIHEISLQTGISVALFGHAGDGNLHPSLLFEDRNPATLEKVAETVIRIFDAALSLGGTVSAEHGLGANKREFLDREHGRETVDLMRSIKSMLDPSGILNPGKIFPSDIELDSSFMKGLPGWL